MLIVAPYAFFSNFQVLFGVTILATIPASAIVQVLPSVLNAGGSSLVMNGLQIHRGSPRIPVGSVLSFASAAAVSAYFGSSSHAFAQAAVYFREVNGCIAVAGRHARGQLAGNQRIGMVTERPD